MVHVQAILDLMKTCVIIPAYNESQTIARLIEEIKAFCKEIVVIDDASVDNTAVMAEKHGAIVLKNTLNLGKGASLAKGFKFAIENNFDAVITLDGDGQHLPEEIPHFLNTMEQSNADVLIGNRMQTKKDMPFIRILTNSFMSWLISKITHQRIPDTQCGYRLFKKSVLEKIHLKTKKYETDSEILIKASRAGFKIESIPIKTIYVGGKSRINPFIDTLRFIRFIIGELWTSKY